MNDANPVPIVLDSIEDNGDATVAAADTIADNGIEAGNIAAVPIEANFATGIGATITTEKTIGAIPDSGIGSAGVGIATGSIPRGRSFYGPGIDSDSAFKSGSIDSTMDKKSPAPKRKAGRPRKTKRLQSLCHRGLCI